ncbi:hypothetical protein RvY_00652 [Ramazzottius varieornatus]|uniref:FAR1 domain-containing protein n=1 Tax=Ramazzottius varieornatus TaxID=947166 RepID=A0A1D1UNW5_RAMVA|nr:hypothetical protein RvY_00652 [Ramazzottius varieornatus]
MTDPNAAIALGGTFQTHQEFEQKLKDPYKHTLEYKFKHLVCKHHGGYEPLMDTERHHTRTNNTGFPAELYLSAEKAQNRFIIRTFENSHNHPVSAELYAQYTGNREEEFRCRNASVQDQVNGVDCAFFALAFAAETVANKNPREISFSGRSLRNWVISSFNAKRATEAKRRPGRPAARVPLNYQDNSTFNTPDDVVAHLAQWTPEPQPDADRRIVPEIIVLE